MHLAHGRCRHGQDAPGRGETAREAKRRGWGVAWSRAFSQESMVPYRQWVEILRGAMSQGLWSRQEITNKPLVYQPLRGLLPEIADLLPVLRTPAAPPPPEQEQLRLWEAARALITAICEQTTLLIVLDDVQWADTSSCELLTYLVRQLRGRPVMFLCTCREKELAPEHLMRGNLTDLQREQAIESIPVNPLSVSEIGELVSHLPERGRRKRLQTRRRQTPSSPKSWPVASPPVPSKSPSIPTGPISSPTPSRPCSNSAWPASRWSARSCSNGAPCSAAPSSSMCCATWPAADPWPTRR